MLTERPDIVVRANIAWRPLIDTHGKVGGLGRGCYPGSMPQLLIQHRLRTRLGAGAETIDACSEPMAGLPLLGWVSAGHPLEAIEDPEWIQAPERLARGADYALRVRGDSMRDEQIEGGDLVLIAQRAAAEDGDTVVALVDDGLATLKRLYRTPDGVRLQPANPDYAPLHRPHGDVEVIGVVVAVMRSVDR